MSYLLNLLQCFVNKFFNFLNNHLKKKNALKFSTKQQSEESYLHIHHKENEYSLTLDARFYVTNEGDITRLLQPPECLVLKTKKNGIGHKLTLSDKSNPYIVVEDRRNGQYSMRSPLYPKTISNMQIFVSDQNIKSRKFQKFIKKLGPFVWVKLKVKDNLGFMITISFRARVQIT